MFVFLCFLYSFLRDEWLADYGLAYRMCRDILNSCVRNTEEAERNSQLNNGTVGRSGGTDAGAGTVGSGRGLGKGVWNMIEESELAKSIRLDEENKVNFHSSFLLSRQN